MRRLLGLLCLLTATFVAHARAQTFVREVSAKEFRLYDPTEDGEPSMQTVARISYDARNLYVLVRAYDPHPDSIVGLLSRRDVRTASDQVKVMVDSYYDRRSGYEFAVNPAGVKRDYYVYDDSREDASWDAVWDVTTKVDSLGWTAEFRIPLSQMRYSTSSPENTFGVMITRDIARTNERISWPVFRRSRPGIVSQFARVDGFRDLSSPRRTELLPYAVTRNRNETDGRAQSQDFGFDAKVGLGSNLTLVAAVNPDFGQVEADPAVLNLGAYEVSFAELRPFFVEGANAFGGDRQLFYSRRIGAGGVPIDAAAKLTGRTAHGFTLGGLAAYADKQTYGLARAARDLRGGSSGIAATMTFVDRDLNASNVSVLRDRALAGSIYGRHRFANDTYEAEATLWSSYVHGSPSAIARTQRTPTHYYNRVDSPLTYDPSLTSLSGQQGYLSVGKVAGVFQWGAQYQYTSPGFETNDLGFLTRGDYQSAYGRASWTSRKPHAFWRNAQATIEAMSEYTADGMPTSNYFQVQGYSQFKNSHQLTLSAWSDYLLPSYCDRCARGGPALRLSPDYNVLVNWQMDTRKKIAPYVAAIYTTADEGRSYLWRVRPLVAVRSGARLNWEFGARYQKNMDNTQWVTNVGVLGADTTRYVFGHLNQDLLSFSARLNYTVTPALSFQYYAEPFVTTGHYSNFRQLSSTPRAASYDARFAPTRDLGNAEDFNVKQFNSNAVVRWEYRPGSALYLVWQQGRAQDDRDIGTFGAARDYRNLFRTTPDNTFLVKFSYWLNL